jgi:hypothetical protein
MTLAPAPWKMQAIEIGIPNKGMWHISIQDKDGLYIADNVSSKVEAQLIICAPDMLTRLQTNYDMIFKLYEMVNHHSNEEVLKQIRTELYETLELIKKAQGAN